MNIPFVSLAAPTWYAANSLYLATVQDPNGNRAFTFKDKKGRTVLARRRNSSGTQEANTYYLYDGKGRLSTVVPPGADLGKPDLLFQYRYDAADNMAYKKVPDAAAVAMKYDSRNLMTLYQDGNLLAAPNNWLATSYDAYGRPTATGLVTNTASPDPNAALSFSAANKLTETTYDDVAGGQAIYKGRVKEARAKVLDGGTTMLATSYAYDAHGRVSATSSGSFTGGSDDYAFSYDWADNLLASTRTHKRLPGDAATTVTERTAYDHAGRAVENRHKLNTLAEATLSQLGYNHRDEPVQKNLGKAGSPPAPTNATWWLQRLDYAYNDQGWLLSVNGPALGGTGTALAACPAAPTAPSPGAAGTGTGNPDPNDLFYLELRYDALFSATDGGIGGMSGTAQKNGSISQAAWRVRGRERQAYRFTYDFLDRMTGAYYHDVADSGTATASGRYDEALSYADHRGNIGTLSRKGGSLSGTCWNFGQIDNLAYAYHPNTNRLKRVTDASGSALGFKPNNGTTSDYAYDANGNLTADPFKGIASISYNHLNLPTVVDMGGGKTVTFVYNAKGGRLKKTVKNGTSTQEFSYFSGIEYVGTAIQSVYHAEGRAFKNGSNWRYEYAISDHLGNTRLTFTDKDGNGVVDVTGSPATNEVLQENHYYPFGLTFDGPWMDDGAASNLAYLYNGKELHADHGLNWYDYGARGLDQALGRWWSVDPMAEPSATFSVYHYAFNNPVSNIDLFGMVGASAVKAGYGQDEVEVPEPEKHADAYLGSFDLSHDPTGGQCCGLQWVRGVGDWIEDASGNTRLGAFGAGLADAAISLAYPVDAALDGYLASIDQSGFWVATLGTVYAATPAGMVSGLFDQGYSAYNGDYRTLGNLTGNVALGLLGGGFAGKANLGIRPATVSVREAYGLIRVRHHTSYSGLRGIKNSGSINASRGKPYGVDVEVAPFLRPTNVNLGQAGRGSYIEFSVPRGQLTTPPGFMGGSGNAGRIVTGGSPLSLIGAEPIFVRWNWLGF